MADQNKTAWGCSDLVWLLVLTFNFGFFIGIPVLAKLLGQDAEKMHWGLKLLGIPFGFIIGGLVMYVISKSEVLLTPVGGITLMIALIVKSLYLWMIVAGIALLVGAAVCLVVSQRKTKAATRSDFLVPVDTFNWLDSTTETDPMERFRRLSELSSQTSESDKLRKQAALFAFNGIAGSVIGLIMLTTGLIKHF